MTKTGLTSCQGDPALHGPLFHVDQTTVNDGDNDVLDVTTDKIHYNSVVCALHQDTDAKTTPTTSLVKHFALNVKVDDRDNSTAHDKSREPHVANNTTASHPPSTSRPGAFARIPLGGDSGWSDGEHDFMNDVVTSGMETVENNNEGLPVANLVADHRLEFALPHSEEPIGQNQNNSKKRKVIVLLPILVFLLAMGAILLAILFPSPADSSQAATSQDVEDSWTIASYPPSQAPSSLGGYVLSLLPEETASTILDDSKSPQSMAFRWLLDDDLLHHMADEQIKQRFALATLYFATNGDRWTNNTNWLNYSVSECDWYTKSEFVMQTQIAAMFSGFLSGFFSAQEGPTTICDQHGLYQHLWLDENYLVGSLPEELYMLTQLRTLSMAFNGLQGTISTRIGLLSGLEAWALSYLPKFGGTIPTQIGLLTNLRFFSMESNGHQGIIPTEVWHLSKLEYLFLSRNPEIKGTIPPEIGVLSNLRWFAMDETALSGTIPSEMGLLQSIKMFSMNRNSFSGAIPSELGLLSSLFYLGLIFSELAGTIPTELGLLTSLSQLSLKGNHLEGPIPSQLGLLTNLEWTLNLRNNQFTGTIPSELGLLTGLTELEVGDNKLTGMIPSELGQATSMAQLSFANNLLSGSVPQELYALHASLHTLSLEDIPLLSGIIPNEVCKINGTCIGNGYNPCEAPYGFRFSCSSLLCGCGCNFCIP